MMAKRDDLRKAAEEARLLREQEAKDKMAHAQAQKQLEKHEEKSMGKKGGKGKGASNSKKQDSAWSKHQASQQAQDNKKMEMQVVLAIRPFFQKMHGATPDIFETLKADLLGAVEERREGLGGQFDTVMQEAQRVIGITQARVDEAQSIIDLETERKRAIENRMQRLENTVAELSDLVDVAEANADLLKEAVMPMMHDLEHKDPASLYATVEEHRLSTETAMQSCSDFIKVNKLLDVMDPTRATIRPQMMRMQQRMAAVLGATTTMMSAARICQQGAAKRAIAKQKHLKQVSMFSKYQGPPGLWSRKAVAAYAKGEFGFEPSQDALDRIFGHPILQDDEGKQVKKGFELDDFHMIKMLIGVERAQHRASDRRKAREEQEKKAAEELAARVTKLTAAKEGFEEQIAVLKTGEDGLDSLEASTVKMEEKIRLLSTLMDNSDELAKLLDEVVGLKDTLEKTTAAMSGKIIRAHQDTEVPPTLQAWWNQEMNRLKPRVERLKACFMRAGMMITSSRSTLETRRSLECEKLRRPVIDSLRKYMKEDSLGSDDVFLKMRGVDEGGITEAEFVEFVKEECTCECGPEDVGKFFEHCRMRTGGLMDMENLGHLLRIWHRVLESTVITAELNIKDSVLVRRLKVGELVEVQEGPVKEKSVGLQRVRCVAMRDGVSGWVTLEGNQGTAYLQEGGNIQQVHATDASLEEGSAKVPSQEDTPAVIRKLMKGETVEGLVWFEGEGDEAKVRVRAKIDGKMGWVAASKLGDPPASA